MIFVISTKQGPVCLVEAESSEEALRILKHEYYDQLLGMTKSWLDSLGFLVVDFGLSGFVAFRAESIPTLADLKRSHLHNR